MTGKKTRSGSLLVIDLLFYFQRTDPLYSKTLQTCQARTEQKSSKTKKDAIQENKCSVSTASYCLCDKLFFGDRSQSLYKDSNCHTKPIASPVEKQSQQQPSKSTTQLPPQVSSKTFQNKTFSAAKAYLLFFTDIEFGKSVEGTCGAVSHWYPHSDCSQLIRQLTALRASDRFLFSFSICDVLWSKPLSSIKSGSSLNHPSNDALIGAELLQDKKDTQHKGQKALKLWQESGLAELEHSLDFHQSIKPHTLIVHLQETGEDREHTPSSPEQQQLSPTQKSLLELPLLSFFSEEEESDSISEPAPPAETSKRAPDLRVKSKLGEGGMGKVLLAHQRSLEREVALKSIKSKQAPPSAVQALLHEGKLMGSLSHPNILPVYALGRDEQNQPILMMKRIEGVSWQDLVLNPTHPTWEESQQSPDAQMVRHLEIFMDVCNAVAFAHQQGILHRDIKPENVMLGAFGEVLLLDWGLGLRLAKRSSEKKAALVGTPAYMAPEMLEGNQQVLSEQTDIYLLGATLHMALMGIPRHTGQTLHQLIFSVVESSPFTYPSHIPEALGKICNKATHQDPNQRYQSVLQLKEEIAAYIRHRGSLQLAEAAKKRLAELESLVQHKEVQGQTTPEASDPSSTTASEETLLNPNRALQIRDAFLECQFGFRQALQQWSDNPEALDGLQKCLKWMCVHELDSEHIESAESLLKSMEEPPAELNTRLEKLKQQREAERLEKQSLLAMKDELDYAKKPIPRILVMVAIFIMGLLAILGSSYSGRAVFEMTYEEALSFDVLLLAILGIGIFWKRKVLLARRIERRFFVLMGVAFSFGFAHRLITFSLDLPLRLGNISENMTVAALCFFAGVAIRPWFFLGALSCATAALMMLFYQKHHVMIYTINGFFMLLFYVFVVYMQLLRNNTPSETSQTTSG